MICGIVAVLLQPALAGTSPEKLAADGRFPARARTLEAFLPTGWTVEERAVGDLNGDRRPDMAAILIEDRPAFDESGAMNERERDLLVVLAERDRTYSLAGSNDQLLQCTTCGGAREGVAIGIVRGVLVLRQYSGSREYTEETWRFRRDVRSGRFVLIGHDIDNRDSGTGAGTLESCNLLNGEDVVEHYQADDNGLKRDKQAAERGRCAKTVTFLENLDPAD